MSTHILTTQTGALANRGLTRVLVASYALSAYTVGTAALFWVILAVGGLAPYGLTSLQTDHSSAAIAINIGLVLIFAVQHTIMARKWFKAAVQRVIPQPIERSTYVLAAGIALAALVYFWQTVPGVSWAVQAPWAVGVIRLLYILGIAYLLGSSFVTNHFELFGLRQAWLYCMGRDYTPVQFKQKWVYRYSRHPMMLGLLLALWASPEMSATRLVMASLLTCYMFIGIQFEERSLVKEFGATYRKYQQEVGMFFTLKR